MLLHIFSKKFRFQIWFDDGSYKKNFFSLHIFERKKVNLQFGKMKNIKCIHGKSMLHEVLGIEI